MRWDRYFLCGLAEDTRVTESIRTFMFNSLAFCIKSMNPYRPPNMVFIDFLHVMASGETLGRWNYFYWVRMSTVDPLSLSNAPIR